MAESKVKLVIDSQEFDAKLKTASQNLQAYFDKVKSGGGSFEHLDDGVMDCAKALGALATKANSTKGSISELTASFTEWSVRYKHMTDAERNTPFGQQIKSSLDQLKTRIQDTKKDLAAINQELSGSKFGQFGGVIDTIGHKMGLTANATELLTSKTALMYAGIGAGIAIIGKATDAWVKYNSELAKQDQITTVTTGLKGSAANQMTDTMRALSDTYKVDFREAVNAANTLMSQFGVNGEEAIRLIKDGMQGMIQGDGPKLLQMIKQYAPAFRDAGVSASQMVAVIHNSEGGIFTDQNMNAIVMGMKNIRLMTKQTSDALSQLGIDGKKMSQDLNAGTITVFDALKQVAGELKNVDSNSQAAGEVMQAVFGRQGVTAGTNIAKAIETLNTNLEETKKQKGELGDAFADLQTANEKLNTAIRDCFEYDGWEQMATGIKAKLVTALSDVINLLDGIGATWDDLMKKMGLKGNSNNIGAGIGGGLMNALPKIIREPAQQISELRNSSDRQSTYNKQVSQYDARIEEQQKRVNQLTATPTDPALKAAEEAYRAAHPEWQQVVNDEKKTLAELQQMRASYMKQGQEVLNEKKTEQPKPLTTDNSGSNKLTKSEQAQAKFEQAEKDYQQALEQAALEVKAGTADTVAAKKKELSAAETLWKSIGDAREIYDSDELKTAQEEAAKKVVELGGSVTKLVEEQKKAQEAAREMAAAQKRVATALGEAEQAYKANDLKGYMSAQKKVGGDPMQGIATGGFTYTESNLNAFIQQLKDQIAQSDLGSELYKNLTAQLADANALANLMQTAVKNGIDISQFNPQDLWRKVFGENPGDYIDSSAWEDIAKRINEELKKQGIEIKINTNTGTTSGNTTRKEANVTQELSRMSGGISSMVSGFKALGAEIPKGVEDVLNGIQGVTSILTGISSILTTIQALTTANTFKLFARGGIVPHAANGYFVPGTHYSGDVTPILANAGELVLNTSSQNSLAAAILNAESLVGSIGDLYNGEKSVFGQKAKSALEDEESAPQSISTAYLQELCEYASSIDEVSKQIYILINNDVMETLHDIKWASAFGGLGLLFSNGGVVRAANGFSGVVPGTHYSGDVTPILANAGEVVLNRAQVGNLASQLGRRDDYGDGSSTPYVTGEQIYLGLNNYLKRSGRGELLTARG